MKYFSYFFLAALCLSAPLGGVTQSDALTIDNRILTGLTHIESLESLLKHKQYQNLSAAEMARAGDLLASAKNNLLFVSMASLKGENETLIQTIEETLRAVGAVAAGSLEPNACIGALLRAGGSLPTTGITRGLRTLNGASQKMYYDLALALQTMHTRSRALTAAARKKKVALAVGIVGVTAVVAAALGAFYVFKKSHLSVPPRASAPDFAAEATSPQPEVSSTRHTDRVSPLPASPPVAPASRTEVVMPLLTAGGVPLAGLVDLALSPVQPVSGTEHTPPAADGVPFSHPAAQSPSALPEFDLPATSNDSIDYSRIAAGDKSYAAEIAERYKEGQSAPDFQLFLHSALNDTSIPSVASEGKHNAAGADVNPADISGEVKDSLEDTP